jgi:hypothetical protein
MCVSGFAQDSTYGAAPTALGIVVNRAQPGRAGILIPIYRSAVGASPVAFLITQQDSQVAQVVVRGACDQGVAQRREERVSVEAGKR